jgi:ABC-type sugar transport system ATPase subunit
MHEGALLKSVLRRPFLRPAHRITADFLGTANFVPRSEKQRQPGLGKWLYGPGTFVRSAVDGGRIAGVVFFRPEYVRFSTEQFIEKTNTGTGIVERVTFLGNSADVVIRCGEIALRVRAHPARTPAAGKKVHFSVVPESCIVFPAEA